MTGIRRHDPHSQLLQLPPPLDAGTMMMQLLAQQMDPYLMEWPQYGFQHMQQYQIPMFGCLPYENYGELIATQGTECTSVCRMPPGLGPKQNEAYELRPHYDLNDRRTTGKRLTATAAVCQKVGDEDIGVEPFSNIIVRLSPLSSLMSQATKTPRTHLSWDCSTPSPSPDTARAPEGNSTHAISACVLCCRDARPLVDPPDYSTSVALGTAEPPLISRAVTDQATHRATLSIPPPSPPIQHPCVGCPAPLLNLATGRFGQPLRRHSPHWDGVQSPVAIPLQKKVPLTRRGITRALQVGEH